MVAFPRFGLIPSVPVLAGIAAGTAAVLGAALMPTGALENAVWNSGLAALVPAAAPPLGVTARAVLALGCGLAAGLVGWASAYLLVGPDGLLARRTAGGDGVPVLRRADAHPDAPARRPIHAAELGTPLMEVAPPPPPVVQPLPADLDQPLAAFDPGAVPDEPRRPVPVVAPLVRKPARLEPGERIATFSLAPTQAMRGGAESRPTIDALLRRLEETAGRRVARG